MRADVCLILEGSYPYITGGVSSWVHQLVTALSEVNFALVTLLPDEHYPRLDKYQLPPNIVSRQDIFLFGGTVDTGVRREARADLVAAMQDLHESDNASRCPFMRTIDRLLRSGKHSAVTLMTARSSWRLLRHLYDSRGRRVSFLDYFWTWRSIHGPMFHLFDVPLPEAAVYHPISTGYAGFLGALAKMRTGGGMMLTEHGLYTREREIEIAHADWIYQEPPDGTAYAAHEAFFKTWWRSQYRFLGQMTYDMADRIITLHEPNRKLQIAAGASADKLQIVPNGIRIDPALIQARLREGDWSARPFRIALIGRVVPIKDIKTYLRAVQLASQQVPIEAYVMGPLDEDPDYHAECIALVEMLGISGTVTFTGMVSVKEWLPRLDLNVLTSVSESQPLVILEAASAGVPSVSTDVGCCRELLEGMAGEDAALGASGVITPVASPDRTAAAIVALARDPARHAAMMKAGLQRVEAYYKLDDVWAAYRKLYANVAGKGA